MPLNFIDLHCHSSCSDGELSPSELLDYASAQNIQLLAITDHDNVDAYLTLSAELGLDASNAYIKTPQKVTLLSGIELSSVWNNHGIHIVGLGMDVTHQGFQEFIEDQKKRRANRVQDIATQLTAMNIKGCDEFLAITANAQKSQAIGRKHFAEFIVRTGQAKNISQAFKHFLSDKKLKNITQYWPSISQSIDVINQSGGTAVLAHPLKYHLSRFKIHHLIKDFVDSGGRAIEVSSSMQSQESTDYLYQKLKEHNLLASVGSDFHQTGLVWQALGKFNYCLPNINTVWSQWPALASIQSH